MTLQEQAELANINGEYRRAYELFLQAATDEAMTHDGFMVLIEKASEALRKDMETSGQDQRSA